MKLDHEVHELVKMIAINLKDWKYAQHNDDGDYAYLVRGDQRVMIHRERQKPTHIIVNTWTWPKSKVTHRGQVTEESYTPSNLYDPKESDPRISVAISRGHCAITRDIQSRFLTEYDRLYKRCEERRDIAQAYHDEGLANWMAICLMLKVTPDHDCHYIKNSENDRESLTIEKRHDGCRITYDANPEEALRIIKAIKPNAL